MLAAEAADTVQKDQASEETKDADGAAAQEAKDTAVQAKVRVAFPTQEGMSYIGHSGKVTGYNYDYLEKVSEYTGLEMDYVAYPSDDGNEAVGNAMNDLIEGKVDLMGPMLKTEQAHQRKRQWQRQHRRRHPVWATLLVVAVTALVALLLFLVWNRYAKQKAAMQRLHNSQLQEALQIAREANESKTTFLSNMSHDIRTPMNAVIGFSTLLAREPDNGVKVREYARKITAASNHLLGLINDILDISKIESGKMTLHQSVFSLEELVESINVVIRPMAGAKKQEFQVHMKDIRHELFVGDKVRLSQILINLLSNAVKYNRPGGRVVLTAKVASRTADAVTCQFGVSDTGIGMSKAFQSRMFEPFSQEQTESPSEYRGTGLGLSIVKAMIDQMGGQITVDSRKGEGTDIVWTLTFPIDREYRETADPEAPAELDLTGKRILAAEDNALNAEIVEMMLEEAGARVTLVDNGKALVEAFAASPAGSFDYILTDVMMPVMDGYEACRAIRAMERADAAAIPIVAMTANAFSKDIRRSLDAGMNAHISKPFDVNKLKQSLAKL